MNDLIFLTYISTFVQILLLSVTIVLGIFTYRTLKTETVVEIGYVSKLLASTQASITHAEIPFPLLATIAHLYNINLNEFQKLWKHEKDTRCRKVLEVYKKDYLTINFIEKFGSKFLLHGYVGSEALLSPCLSITQTTSSTPHSARSRRPPKPFTPSNTPATGGIQPSAKGERPHDRRREENRCGDAALCPTNPPTSRSTSTQ